MQLIDSSSTLTESGKEFYRGMDKQGETGQMEGNGYRQGWDSYRYSGKEQKRAVIQVGVS